GVLALAAQLLGDRAHVAGCPGDPLAGLGRALVDLVAEPAPCLAERASRLVLGHRGLLPDLILDLVGGATALAGRPDRDGRGVGAVLAHGVSFLLDLNAPSAWRSRLCSPGTGVKTPDLAFRRSAGSGAGGLRYQGQVALRTRPAPPRGGPRARGGGRPPAGRRPG